MFGFALLSILADCVAHAAVSKAWTAAHYWLVFYVCFSHFDVLDAASWLSIQIASYVCICFDQL